MIREEELTGGRITAGVVRKGGLVCRPVKENSPFVHEVLRFLDGLGGLAPRCHGIDGRGREMLDYLEGEVPADLGYFTDEQCIRAAELIRTLHRTLEAFPGCPAGMTVCHRDLSPCNFVFRGSMPAAVIDWDAAAFGDPLDDLAYAVWMWLDMGNDELDPADVRRRARLMLAACGAEEAGFRERILRQMERVGNGIFPTAEQAAAVRAWTEQCRRWTEAALTGGF